ncbi:hypothetical protein E3N86_06990 [Cryobacterium sp. Hz7]|nr:hypothetical protein E3N86_06990 [Cryobacterium sp. Hz7]
MQPSPEIGPVTVRAPVSGTLVRVQPHAFVIQSTSGTGILVHLGIDTVHMNGEGFEVLATEGSTVRGRCGVGPASAYSAVAAVGQGSTSAMDGARIGHLSNG